MKSTIVNKIYVTMLWAFQQLKGMPHLNHVTSIAHGLHRVCESIRENYNSVNYFIAALKKILVKAPGLQVLFQEVTGIHLPRFPVIIWIRCTFFLCKTFDEIKFLRLNRWSSHEAGPTISQQQRPRVQCMIYIVLYCIEGVVIAAQCTATFSDLLCSPEFWY